MGRFSPTVLPQYPIAGMHIGDELGDALDRAAEMKRRAIAAGDAHTAAQIADIEHGLRSGQPPVAGGAGGGGAPVAVAGSGSQGSMANRGGLSLADAMRGAPTGPNLAGHGAPPIDLGASFTGHPSTLSGLKNPAPPSLSDAMNGAPQPVEGEGGDGGGEAVMQPGTLRPGAFDPISGAFATSHGIPSDQRYVPLDQKRYVDLQANTGLSRALMQAEERAHASEVGADARVQAAALGANSRTAVAGTNATSRQAVAGVNAGSRESVAAGNRKAALARVERAAELAGQNAAAHDTRVATRGTNGRTPAQQQAWAKSMADGIIQMHDGDLSAAEDFLSNDERGAQYSAQGLTGNDLYAAAGRYRQIETGDAARAMGAVGGGSPDAAKGTAAGLRPAPTPGSEPRPKKGALPSESEVQSAFEAGPDTPDRRAKYEAAMKAIGATPKRKPNFFDRFSGAVPPR